MREPLVTVLMPVYNAAGFVREAVASILRQTFTDFEFLIINDGSYDDSQKILESCSDARISLLVNGTNQGISAALNQGLAQARGKYIARQDADDVSHPQRLARQVAFLEADPSVALLGSQYRIRGPQSAARRAPVLRALSHEAIQFQALFANPFAHSSVMYRRAIVWQQLRGYSTTYRICQDFELWLRVLQQHRVANLAEYLVDLGVHSQSISRNAQARDANAREQLLRENLPRLMADDRGLGHWPQAWASASFRPHSMTREDFRQLIELATLCLRRGMAGKDLRLRKQMRRAYGDYLLTIAHRQRRSQLADALRSGLRAARASPATAAAAAVWIVGSWLESVARRARVDYRSSACASGAQRHLDSSPCGCGTTCCTTTLPSPPP
jgi:glycosyltransferase involved in cell wall biosynthesis